LAFEIETLMPNAAMESPLFSAAQPLVPMLGDERVVVEVWVGLIDAVDLV
jgi:hypothetical protein